jgi:hypothetical protein
MGLKFGKKPQPPIAFSERLVKRVAKIPTADLLLWIEQAMSETNRSCTSYIKASSPADLDDMMVGAEAIHYLVAELHRRTNVL